MDMKKILATVKFFGKKYAPELLLGTAAVAGTACIVTSCRATIKAKKSLEEHQERKLLIADKLQTEEITSEESKVEMRKEIVKVGLELAKEYAIPFSLYTATIGCVLGCYKIQKSRLQAVSATLSAMSAAYSSLVARLKNGLTAEEVLNGKVAFPETDEDGNPTGEVNVMALKHPNDNPFKFRFDRYCTSWEKHHFSNECILKAEENWANSILQCQGYLFLNDVLDRLGIPRTKAGQILGWRSNGNGDGFVDFGVVDCQTLTGVEYDDNAFELNFNVDGDILTTFPRE